MRAFIGQFDSVSRAVFGLGLAIAVWLVLLDLGVILAFAALLVGSVLLITQGRWLEIGLLMIGIGLVVQVGYWILGPPEPPAVSTSPSGLPPGTLPVEDYAPGTAGLLLFGGFAYTIVVGAWELAEGRRRERLEARRARRRSTWSEEP